MAVAAASDLNSVESSYSVGTSGVHSWEQSVDPYDPTGHGFRPVRSKKDLMPHEYDNSSYANETNHLFCPTTGNIVSGPRYLNDITTLFVNSQEVSVKLLFHLRRAAMTSQVRVFL
ncbi:hypothetical protein EMCRGX_G016928 [Ephydatia muelleri]